MSILIDGKFNPKCVQRAGSDVLVRVGTPALAYQCENDESAQGVEPFVRDCIKTALEAALGRKLDNYAEPEAPLK